MAAGYEDRTAVKTQPLGEPIEAAAEVIDRPAPTIYEQAYWDQDDERIGAAFDALIGDKPNVIAPEHKEEFDALRWKLEVDNRLRQKELALKIGELMSMLAALSAAEAPKPRKRVARVPKAALPALETPDDPDAA